MDTQQPKDVIIFQHDELAYHPERHPEYSPEYFDNIDVCSIEYELPSLKDKISFYPTTPSVGDTFVRSPYKQNVYINISELKDYIILQKYNCLVDIATDLGAKKMEGTFIVNQAKTRIWDASANIKCKYVECNASVKQTEQDELNKTYKLESQLIGKSTTIEDWERAEKKAKEYNLKDDPNVRIMLNALKPIENGGNRLVEHSFSCTMSTETNKALDIAFNLNSVAGIFKLGADFHSSTKYRYETIVKMKFVFPE